MAKVGSVTVTLTVRIPVWVRLVMGFWVLYSRIGGAVDVEKVTDFVVRNIRVSVK